MLYCSQNERGVITLKIANSQTYPQLWEGLLTSARTQRRLRNTSPGTQWRYFPSTSSMPYEMLSVCGVAVAEKVTGRTVLQADLDSPAWPVEGELWTPKACSPRILG